MKDFSRYFLILASIAVAGLIFWYFGNLVAYILISAVISLIGQPLVAILCKIKIGKFIFPRSLGAAITLIVILCVFYTFFRVFVPIVAHQARQMNTINSEELVQNLSGPIKSAEAYFGGLHLVDTDQPFDKYVTGKIISFVNVSQLSKVFGSIAGMLGNIFVALFAITFISFFFLKDESLFTNMVQALVPVKQEKKIKTVMFSINKLLRRYFIGICIDVILIITLVTTGMLIAGLKLEVALIIGLFAGVMNVIPYVGPLISIAFGFMIAILNNMGANFYADLMPMLGYMFIVFLVVNILDATLIQPLIFSNSVKAHPLEIFLVIMLAGSIAGVAGMICAIPVYTILRVIAKEFFNEFKVVKKLTENM